MKFGIGIKLSILLAAFGIMAAGLAGYYSYTASRSLLLGAAERDLRTATQVLGRNILGALDETATNVQLLAALPAAQAVLTVTGKSGDTTHKQVLADAFSAMLTVHPEYFQIRLIGAADNGLELVRVDRNGRTLMRVRADDLQEKAHYPYVFDALRQHQSVYFSRITINHEAGAHAGLHQPTLRIAKAVHSSAGQPIGVVVIGIDINRIFEQLKTDLPRDYQLYLSNKWGDFLIHPDPAQTFGFDQGRRILIQDSYPAVLSLIKSSAASVVVRSQDAPSGENRMATAFVRLPLGGPQQRNFLVLGLAKPLNSIMQESTRLGQNILQIVIGFSIIALMLAALIARAVTGPLHSMVAAARLFSREHTLSPLPIERGDELGLLARSFHAMQTEVMAHLDALNQRHQTLDHLVRHDPLTGLPNRRMFFDRLEHSVANARRHHRQLAVLFVDIDYFKEINDRYGHAVGDAALIAVAQVLKSTLREVDTLARLSGDEFVILFDVIDDEPQLMTIINKLHGCFQNTLRVGEHEMKIYVSMGVSLYPKDGSSAAELMQHADLAMYRSKNGGRNTFSFYTADTPDP